MLPDILRTQSPQNLENGVLPTHIHERPADNQTPDFWIEQFELLPLPEQEKLREEYKKPPVPLEPNFPRWLNPWLTLSAGDGRGGSIAFRPNAQPEQLAETGAFVLHMTAARPGDFVDAPAGPLAAVAPVSMPANCILQETEVLIFVSLQTALQSMPTPKIQPLYYYRPEPLIVAAQLWKKEPAQQLLAAFASGDHARIVGAVDTYHVYLRSLLGSLPELDSIRRINQYFGVIRARDAAAGA